MCCLRVLRLLLLCFFVRAAVRSYDQHQPKNQRRPISTQTSGYKYNSITSSMYGGQLIAILRAFQYVRAKITLQASPSVVLA
jgi:hypothetical protein